MAADAIRYLFNVFMMPLFFFVAGYFAMPSLERHGTWSFIKGKLRRLGIPWLVGILIIVPLIRRLTLPAADVGPSLTFWQYWIEYLRSFGAYQVGILTPERMHQMHFWFLSLLLTFSIALALFYALRHKRSRPTEGTAAKSPVSSKSVLAALSVAAVLTTLGSFAVALVTPDISWVTVNLLWQFQPTGLISFIACFVLGCYAYSRQWFVGDAFPRRLLIWIPIGALLTVGFFIVGQEIFAHPFSSNDLAPGPLLAFSFVRTLVCLAFLVIFIAYARRYWNRPSRSNQVLAASSYSIYLTHIFFVTILQDILMIWPGGSAMAKAGIVFAVALPMSYGVSRLIDRFPRVFVGGFVALLIIAFVAL
jgi:glucan biosynthesis protein C